MTYDYAIIGGGVTGLYLAYRLQQQGHKVVLLEKSTEVGGLAAVTTRYGTPIEKAYHHFFPTDYPLIKLVTELGLLGSLQWKSVPMGMYFIDRMVPFSSPFHLLQLPHLSPVDKVRLGATMWYLQKTKNWEQFKMVKAAEWLRKKSGSSAFKLFWKPLLESKFSQHYEDVSLAWLWARFFVRAQAKPGLFAKEQLGYILGSIHELYKALLHEIHDVVKTGIELEAITKNRHAWKIVAKQGSYEAKKVIMTIPTPAAYSLIGKQAPSNITYLGAMVGTFASSQNLTPYYWTTITSQHKSPFVVFLHHTKLVDRVHYQNRYLYYYGAYLPRDHRYFDDPTVFQKESYEFLPKLFPEFSTEHILDQEVNAFPFAQQVVDTTYHTQVPPLKLDAGLYLCNFSQIYPFDRGVSYAIGKADELLKML